MQIAGRFAKSKSNIVKVVALPLPPLKLRIFTRAEMKSAIS